MKFDNMKENKQTENEKETLRSIINEKLIIKIKTKIWKLKLQI